MNNKKNICPFPKFHPSQLNRDDSFYMQLAYNEAIRSWEEDEVPIGALITHNGQIIASAHNAVDSLKDPTAHAEILAITQAANAIGDWRLNECTLYVTKEPCPMCSGAAIMARLERVVFAFEDPKMGCLGGAHATHLLPHLNHKLQVTPGILRDPCHQLVRAFFAGKRRQDSFRLDDSDENL